MHAFSRTQTSSNKTFRARQHPQPLDQWTNSPFMRQQVGNWGFTLTHNLVDQFAMHRGPGSIPLCVQHHIQLASLSFQVSRPSHSWDATISMFYLENPGSSSSVRSKFTTWVQHPIKWNPVFFMTIRSPIPMTQIFFQNYTLKTQSQGHSWRPYSRYNSISTHIPFVRCGWALAFLYTVIWKFDL